MPLCQPIYDPGNAFTGRATGAAVTGCRVVTVAATKVDGGNILIKHCAAADEPIGVAGIDMADGFTGVVYPPGIVLPILVGGTGIIAGEKVEVLDTGTVQTLASGTKVGVAITTTAAAGFGLVQLQF